MNWLFEKGPWGMTWHEWLACLAGGFPGAWGFYAVLSGAPWQGVLSIMFGLFLRYTVLAQDLDNRR